MSDPPRDPARWHLLLVALTSTHFESLFIRHGMNKLDEGWPLYAAMRLLDGGALYQDVFWVFPPGHVLPALLGVWIDPPGLVWTRAIYAAFSVLLCVGMYALGRRLMSPSFAFLGAMLIAIANPRSHIIQALFGYRYLVFSVVGLLLFDRRLRSGLHRYSFFAGLCGGVAVVFRITPAFALSAAVAVGALFASRDWRSWLRDWSLFASGLLLVALPVCAWFGSQVGLLYFWREAIIHPVEMLQPLPWPELALPDEWTRASINELFVNAGFRMYWLLYLGYAGALLWLWLRSLRDRTAYPHALLAGVVVWGMIFFIRSLGRSDYPHLASVMPPICLLLAHALSLAVPRLFRTAAMPRLRRALVETAVGVSAFVAWGFLHYSDYYLWPANRGLAPLTTLGGAVSLWGPDEALYRDDLVRAIRARSDEGELLLDMSASPIFHPLSGRTGPGWLDVIMPGTFLSAEEERAFVQRLEARPPALVLLRRAAFDDMPERAVTATAPQVSAWVALRYEGIPYRDFTDADEPFHVLLRRRAQPLAEFSREQVVQQLVPPESDR